MIDTSFVWEVEVSNISVVNHASSFHLVQNLHSSLPLESLNSSPFQSTASYGSTSPSHFAPCTVKHWIRVCELISSSDVLKWNITSCVLLEVSSSPRPPSVRAGVKGRWPCSPGRRRSVGGGGWAVCSGLLGPHPATGWSEGDDDTKNTQRWRNLFFLRYEKM